MQISLQDARNPTGSIYNRVPTNLERMHELTAEQRWNAFEIRACGSHIQITLNGEMVQDCDLHGFTRGVIGLQQHHPGVTVKFRNLRIKRLQSCNEGWRPLFNGKDLSGWFATGLARWSVKDGAIVGEAGMGHLFTEQTFTDFELRAMIRIRPFKDDSPMRPNNGIYFRAQPNPENPNNWPVGYEAQVFNHAGRDYITGSLYNRVPTNLERMRELTAEQRWNAFEIRACGSHIQITLNGEMVQDCDLHGFTRGVIGLQQHHPGVTVKFRNLRIKRLQSCNEGWRPLFNGKDLSGWFATGLARWSVKDGAIIGEAGMGHLFTEQTFTDFELRAMIRIRPFKDDSPMRPNNGIYVRAQPNPENPSNWPVGYEAQVFNHAGRDYITGSLYNRVMASRLLTRDGDWFSMRIRAKGDHIQIFVNGQKVVDTRNRDFRSGRIAIQCHDPFTIIETRDLYWRPL